LLNYMASVTFFTFTNPVYPFVVILALPRRCSLCVEATRPSTIIKHVCFFYVRCDGYTAMTWLIIVWQL